MTTKRTGRRRVAKRSKAAPALTGKQQRFVEEYLVDSNATQAAIRAGYARSGAEVQGHRLLRNAGVLRALEAARAQHVIPDLEKRKRRWLEENDLIAHSDVGDILDFSGDQLAMRPANQIPVRARKAISSVKVKRYVEGRGEDAQVVELVEFKLWSKDAALERLGKHAKLTPETHEHTGKDGKPIQHEHREYVAEWGGTPEASDAE